MARRWCALGLALVACGAPALGDSTGETGETTGETDGSTADLDDPLAPLQPRPTAQRCRLDGTPAEALPRRVAERVEQPAFTDAVALLPDPSAGLWVVGADGRVWGLDDPDADAPARVVVDLRDRVDCCGSRGLLAVALGPELAGERWLFAHYHTAADPNRTRVTRLRYDPELGLADPDSELLVIEIVHEGTAASGGGLAFDGAGMLVIGVGDGLEAAPANPASSPARELGDRRGALLRVDVSNPAPGFAIPPDNPFVAHPEALPELFALGVHDPRGCFGDPAGRVWCSDRGGGQREELDAAVAGGDFGWPIVEGFTCAAGECEPTLYNGPHAEYGVVDPDADLDHCELVAGYGHGSGEAEGVLLYGDRCSGRIFGLRSKVGPGAVEIVASLAGGLAAIGADADGEPWVVDGEGRLARLVVGPGGTPGTLPRWLSQTDCFEWSGEASGYTPGPDLVAYLVASALWSDGLLKQRYLVVPPDQRVQVTAEGRWSFPDGSVLIKTFIHEAEAGEPSSRRPIETRFMVRRNDAWEFHGYRWTDDGSDAELLDGESERILDGVGPEGPLAFAWTFPDRIGCRNCHGFAGGRPLGPTSAQLNREVRYGDGAPEPQLAALAALDLLSLDPGLSLAELPALADPRDLDQPLAARARAYFQANCAHCHRPEWMRPDLRATTALDETGLCEPVEFPSPWVPGFHRIVPGAPEDSNLWLRMGTRGFGQMPPLGTAIVDADAHALVGEWIAQLSACTVN